MRLGKRKSFAARDAETEVMCAQSGVVISRMERHKKQSLSRSVHVEAVRSQRERRGEEDANVMAAAKRENEPPSYTLLLLLLLPPKYIYVCTQEWMLLLLLLHQCRREEKEEFGVNVAVISIVPAKKDVPCRAHYNKKPLSLSLLFSSLSQR